MWVPPVEDELHILFYCPLYSSARGEVFRVVRMYGLAAPDGKVYFRWDLNYCDPLVFAFSLLTSRSLHVHEAVATFLLSAKASRKRWVALHPMLPSPDS